jgi:hypothetical protein
MGSSLPSMLGIAFVWFSISLTRADEIDCRGPDILIDGCIVWDVDLPCLFAKPLHSREQDESEWGNSEKTEALTEQAAEVSSLSFKP